MGHGNSLASSLAKTVSPKFSILSLCLKKYGEEWIERKNDSWLWPLASRCTQLGEHLHIERQHTWAGGGARREVLLKGFVRRKEFIILKIENFDNI